MRARSWGTIAPAPRLRWPTSELPICPSGSPTLGPIAISCVCGCLAHSSSNTGVFASETALPGPSGASPQPSSTTSVTAGTAHDRAASTIAANDSASSEAPPIRPPSMSGWASSSAALSAFIEPP